MRKKLIAGNWKMNLNIKESEKLAAAVAEIASAKEITCDMLICPAFISLAACAKALKGSRVSLGAQNVSDKDDGAYTGEISASMLLSAGCEYVIIGHSERRKYYGEDNEIVNLKVRKAIAAGLKPIMCVGESLQEREDEIFEAIVSEQVTEGLKDVTEEELGSVTIAYEPVWAIGTGVNATPKQASDMHGLIGKMIHKSYSKDAAELIRIIYGGSVNGKNASEILKACGVDGALVGGASLKPDDFRLIAEAASKA